MSQILTLPDLMLVRSLGRAPLLRDGGEGESGAPGEPGTGGDQAGLDAAPAGAEPDVLGEVYGHFCVFSTWYEINSFWEGEFLEQVAPGAFAKTFAERAGRIVSAFDHGYDPQIGDKVLGPFTALAEDQVGAAYAIDLLDTSYNRDLRPALRRGLYGSSFRFQVIKDEWSMEPDPSLANPRGLPERTIREVRLYEAGPVTYPASPAATAGMRGGTDRWYEGLRGRDPQGVDRMAAQLQGLRTAQIPPAGQTTGASGAAAPAPPAEPARSHSGIGPAQRRVALYPYLRGVSA
jgi:HK97 family phage prohead protease